MKPFRNLINSKPHSILSYAERLKRLRITTCLFLVIMMLPLIAVIYFALQQIAKSQLDNYQEEATSFIESANKALTKRRLLTNALPVDAFNYYRQIVNPVTQESLQVLSPLSELNYRQPKISGQVVGLVGFFQFNQEGLFNSPIWPHVINDDKGLKKPISGTSEWGSNIGAEPTLRKKTATELYQLVMQSETIEKLLTEDLNRESPLFRSIFDIPEHVLFYRISAVANQQYIQGYVVRRSTYFSLLMAELLEGMRFDMPLLVTFQDTVSGNQTEQFVYQPKADEAVDITSTNHPPGVLKQHQFYSTKMPWPYGHIGVTFSTDKLPVTAAMLYSSSFSTILILAITISVFGFYRLGVKQLQLAEQRLNFVSSVSHELKTPLTSIRMYAEMLKQGMVITEQHKQEYHQFIFEESERLTRLINNILQLASLSHQQQKVQPKPMQLSVLADIIRSKTSFIVDKHDFQQNIINTLEQKNDASVLVDPDAFAQVVINITDNAIKFFDKEKINDVARQKIDFIFQQHPQQEQKIKLEIRDYGDGITEEQEHKIFELFYRGGNELTRTTQGTGIGLALANELMLAQSAHIEAQRKQPGLSLILSFQYQHQDQ